MKRLTYISLVIMIMVLSLFGCTKKDKNNTVVVNQDTVTDVTKK